MGHLLAALDGAQQVPGHGQGGLPGLDYYLTQVYKKQKMSFSFPGPKIENIIPTLPNNQVFHQF